MVDEILLRQIGPLGGIDVPRKTTQPGATEKKGDFSRILDEKLSTGNVTFSRHAEERIRARGISFSEAQMETLKGAVNTLEQKGGKESLVMLGDTALVVSVKNRTVITAVGKDQLTGNIFTNIDSAVIL